MSESENQTPADVLEELRDSLEEIAEHVEAAITPEMAQDTPAESPEAPTPAEAPTPPPSESPASVIASVANAVPEQLTRQLALMHDNLNLVQQRLENHGNLFGAATNDLHDLMTDLKDTLGLHQQVVSEFDRHVENLGLVAAALTKMHAQVMKALTGQTPNQS